MAVDVVAVIAGIVAIVIPDTAAEFPVSSGVYAPVGTTCRIYRFRYRCCWLPLLLVTVASQQKIEKPFSGIRSELATRTHSSF